jgi:hypothetical protein
MILPFRLSRLDRWHRLAAQLIHSLATDRPSRVVARDAAWRAAQASKDCLADTCSDAHRRRQEAPGKASNPR